MRLIAVYWYFFTIENHVMTPTENVHEMLEQKFLFCSVVINRNSILVILIVVMGSWIVSLPLLFYD